MFCDLAFEGAPLDRCALRLEHDGQRVLRALGPYARRFTRGRQDERIGREAMGLAVLFEDEPVPAQEEEKSLALRTRVDAARGGDAQECGEGAR